MTVHFPPQPIHKAEIKILVEILVSVVPGREAVYVSAPITSGKRFLTWFSLHNRMPNEPTLEYHNEFVKYVIEPNRAHAKLIVQDFRAKLKKVLIDPTAVEDFEGWNQDDYRVLWATIIERYVNTAIFLDDWQYSNGCAFEFLKACQSNVKTMTEKQEPLALFEGIELIITAINEMKLYNQPTYFLESVLKELSKLNLKKSE